jgi:hypothetical protein
MYVEVVVATDADGATEKLGFGSGILDAVHVDDVSCDLEVEARAVFGSVYE